jgi:hypothetical protein
LGGICAAYALTGDLVGAEIVFQRAADSRSHDEPLRSSTLSRTHVSEQLGERHTMLPCSVEPRAKIKVTSRQGPLSSSLELMPWRA